MLDFSTNFQQSCVCMKHHELLFLAVESLKLCPFVVFSADHGFNFDKLRSTEERPKLSINHRRPDVVFLIGRKKFALEIQTNLLYHSDRLIAQLNAFAKAKYDIILVVPSSDLQRAKIALQLANTPPVYAIVDLPGFESLIASLRPEP